MLVLLRRQPGVIKLKEGVSCHRRRSNRVEHDLVESLPRNRTANAVLALMVIQVLEPYLDDATPTATRFARWWSQPQRAGLPVDSAAAD